MVNKKIRERKFKVVKGKDDGLLHFGGRREPCKVCGEKPNLVIIPHRVYKFTEETSFSCIKHYKEVTKLIYKSSKLKINPEMQRPENVGRFIFLKEPKIIPLQIIADVPSREYSSNLERYLDERFNVNGGRMFFAPHHTFEVNHHVAISMDNRQMLIRYYKESISIDYNLFYFGSIRYQYPTGPEIKWRTEIDQREFRTRCEPAYMHLTNGFKFRDFEVKDIINQISKMNHEIFDNLASKNNALMYEYKGYLKSELVDSQITWEMLNHGIHLWNSRNYLDFRKLTEEE